MNTYPVRKVFFQLFVCSMFVGGFAFFDACGPGRAKDYCESSSDCTKVFDQTYKCDTAKNKCIKKTTVDCEKNDDCVGDQICESGKCIFKQPAETTNPDGGNADKPVGNDPGPPKEGDPCSCPVGKVCNSATKECVDCLADSDCNPGGNTCTADCTSTTNKICKQNKCEAGPCECPIGQTCDATSKQCTSGQTCPGGGKPDANGNCPKPCAGTQCPAGEAPDPGQACKCIKAGAWCSACTTDAECGPTGKCTTYQSQKFCAEDCTNSGTCTDPTYQCLNHGDYKSCIPSSGSCPCLGTQCTSGQKCCKSDGACHECCDNTDCPSGKVCHNVTYKCEEDKCKGVTCNAPSVCNPGTGKCDCPAQCPQGQCCGNGQCSVAACGGTTGCPTPCKAGEKCCDVFGQKSCLPQCLGGSGGGCKTDADCTDPAASKCCDLLGQKICMDASGPMALFCGGGSSGSCKSDADCTKNPATPKCCPGLLPILPSSCKAKCGGFP